MFEFLVIMNLLLRLTAVKPVAVDHHRFIIKNVFLMCNKQTENHLYESGQFPFFFLTIPIKGMLSIYISIIKHTLCMFLYLFCQTTHETIHYQITLLSYYNTFHMGTTKETEMFSTLMTCTARRKHKVVELHYFFSIIMRQSMLQPNSDCLIIMLKN